MRAYLCDWKYESDRLEQCAWYTALRAALGGHFVEGQTQWAAEPPLLHCAYVDPGAVLFAHSDGLEEAWRQKANEETTRCHVVLVRSAGGQKSETNGKRNLHGCFWSPVDFAVCGQSGAKPEVTEFCRQLAREEADKIDWDLLRPAATDHVLALRILCEAWLLVNRSTAESPRGIVIRTPGRPVDWFAPFGKDPSEEAANDIANQMGEHARVEVRSVLEELASLCAAEGSEASVGDLPDFGQSIKKLAGTLKSTTR